MNIYVVLYGKEYSMIHRMKAFTKKVEADSLIQGLIMSPHNGDWDIGGMPIAPDHPFMPTTMVKRWVCGPRWIELHKMEVEG